MAFDVVILHDMYMILDVGVALLMKTRYSRCIMLIESSVLTRHPFKPYGHNQPVTFDVNI